MRRNIAFKSESLTLAGWLYVPDGLREGERRAAIVMAQHDDYLNAISWTQLQPEVDPERIGAHIELISPTPLLMIVASDDVLTPTDLAIATYERARTQVAGHCERRPLRRIHGPGTRSDRTARRRLVRKTPDVSRRTCKLHALAARLMSMLHRVIATACALVVATTGAALLPALAATAPLHIRGTIVSTTATSLTVKTASGPVTVVLTPKTGYAGATAGSLADIKTGGFLGIASVPNGSTSKALEVTVFPSSMRGRGEGDYPWDLPAGGSHSAMTNGTVALDAAAKPHSMMTNATVSKMSGGNGTTVTMTYKGGSRTITIPPGAAIVKVEPGSSKLLAPNAHVFVVPKKAARGVVGAFVVVGENGTIPPM